MEGGGETAVGCKDVTTTRTVCPREGMRAGRGRFRFERLLKGKRRRGRSGIAK